jgi:hypothetical protein
VILITPAAPEPYKVLAALSLSQYFPPVPQESRRSYSKLIPEASVTGIPSIRIRVCLLPL